MKSLKVLIAFALVSVLCRCSDPEVAPVVEEQPSGPPKTEVRISVPEKDFEITVDEMTDKGYVPVYIDGFVHKVGSGNAAEKSTFFNIIFKEDDHTSEYKFFHGLNKGGLEATIDLVKDSYNLIFLESYPQDDEILFAAIFSTGEPTQFHTELMVSFNTWQAKFDQLVNQGYRMACRSTVLENGVWYVSALFDKTNVGNWVSSTSMSPEAMEQKIIQQSEKGRTISHFDVLQETSSQYTFGAIFDSKANSFSEVMTDMTSTELMSSIALGTSSGYVIQTLSAYDEKVVTGPTWYFNTLYVATWRHYSEL